MKKYLIFLFPLLPFLLGAQSVDSTAIRQVDSLIQISRDLTYKGYFDMALEINAVAEKIALEKLGKASAENGSACFNHGRILDFKSDSAVVQKHHILTEAERWYRKSLAIREEVLGNDHPDYAWSLSNLAVLYHGMRQYEKSEPLYLEAKTIREKVLGKKHPEYAMSLNHLGVLYQDMYQYEKAEPLLLEAKVLREKVFGKEHSEYAMILNNLAIMYRRLGKYEKAEPLFLEASAIRKKALGKEHPDYAASVNGLANLYEKMGQLKKAEILYLEAKDIYESVWGSEHPAYATILLNLALLYEGMGQYQNAEPLFLEAKIIFSESLGKEHPAYATSLNNLALMYKSMGQYENAEPLFLEAKGIWGKIVGEKHPDYAGCLQNLAALYKRMGQYEKAESLFIASKNIWEKVWGRKHPAFAGGLLNLALLYHKTGQYQKAEPLFLELSLINRELIENALLHLSEKELNTYLNTFLHGQYGMLSFTQKSDKLIPTCYDNSLFYKGFLLQAAGRIKQLAGNDDAATEKLNQLKGYQRRLAEQYAQPIARRDSVIIADLETKANDLEKDLARMVSGWQEERQQVRWQQVQSALQAKEAAVEFVHYSYYDKKPTDSTMYGALILLPGKVQPRFIPLFEEQQLESLFGAEVESKIDNFNALYTVAERGITPKKASEKSIYELISAFELIWQPLEQELEDVNHIYYSPTGLLHRLNLNAIPVGEDKTLGDRYQLTRLNSTRQLVFPTNVEAGSQDAVLYGGVQYEMDTTAIATANEAINTDLIASRGGLSFSSVDSTQRGGSWNYLQWTDKEVDKIETTLKAAGYQTNVLKGYNATEESFKAIGQDGTSPRIIHMATHGFFFPDPVSDISEGDNEPVFKMSDHPMIRSGLILAGGNHAWKTGQPLQPDMEDGILTAYEISQMNLSNTELVVLSACETGLGDIKGNEGVYGLQRAFKIAGAKYLIMSLWQIPDKETAFFMDIFYKKLNEEGMTIPKAFAATQATLRENPLITPYQWAGFVLME